MKTLSKHLAWIPIVFMWSAAVLDLPGQELKTKPKWERLTNPPAIGSFYFVQRTNLPPFPFDPFRGQLPVYALNGIFLIDDSQVDYPALRAVREASLGRTAESQSLSSLGTPNPGDGGTGTNTDNSGYAGLAYDHPGDSLWLEITGLANDLAQFTIHSPDPYGPYDLFGTTNLSPQIPGLNLTNWVWLTRTDWGQTNLSLTNLWPKEGWFRLGTMLDSDSDGLPDAFEQIVSKTNPSLRDSDGDGLADGDEIGANGLPWGLEQARRNSVVAHATVPAAVEGGADGQVTVYLPAPAPAGGVTVQYHFGGTAAGGDFTTIPAGNTLSIPAGASSGTISIHAVNNSEFEDYDRYAEVRLTNATAFAVDSQPASVTLVDNDLPQVRVFAFPQWVRKPSPTYGTNPAAFYFIRDGDSSNAVTLQFNLTGGTAQSGVDYNALATSVTFPAGVRTNLLPVTLKPTTNVADRTLVLNLASASGYQIDPAAGAATMTIASSTLAPLPVVQVVATDDLATEANGSSPTGTFTFSRSGPTTLPLRVTYRITGTATPGSPNSARDYLELPGYLDIPAGAASAAVTVTPLDDDISETMETVQVVLSGGDYQIGANNTATVYIDDNEPISYLMELLRDGVSGVSLTRPAHVRITRTGYAQSSMSFPWQITYGFTPNTLQGSGVAGDVVGTQAQWAARQSVINLYVTTTWTAYDENPKNATLRIGTAVTNSYFVNIPFHPISHLVRVASIGSPATIVNEGSTTTVLSFTRPYPSSSSLTVSFSPQGSANLGSDYDNLPGSVLFPANNGGPITVSVHAFTNAQTNGWRTSAVTINSAGSGAVGEAGQDRAYFRIQDAQAGNPVADTDLDDDGLTDGWELANGYDPLAFNNPYVDWDRDGLALFEEIQLGTSTNLADAQPVFPSEDPDDYATLTLRLGASGKLTGPSSCASCHEAGLRAGAHLRTTPRTSWENQQNVQNHSVRFLRGTNYPVRLLDNPYPKVLPNGMTNTTVHRYTAAYTAQFLSPTSTNYPFVSDTNQIFGTNRPMVLEALAKTATLHVPDLLIAADVDRDGVVNPASRADRTSTNAPFTFWINDDVDVGNDDTAGDEEPGVSPNPINSATLAIDNLRDLEDFTRLHFRVDGLLGGLLTNSGMRLRIYLTNLAGSPSLRLFRAVETNGGAAYLTNETTAAFQLGMGAFGLVTNGTPLTLLGSEWKPAGTNRFFLPALFEGVSTGRCVVVFAIASNTGPDIAVSRPFHLELLPVSRMYEHWTVGDSHTIPWNEITNRASRTPDSAAYGSTQRPEELDYILFVHGWRMQPWERRSFASTSYKRLWHLNYRGRFGLFSWPTDWVESLQIPLAPQNYDRSERRAYWSAPGLQRLFVDLNRAYPDRVRVVSHSMGAVVTSEALRLKGLSPRRPVLHTYIASQGATVAHAYDALNPETKENSLTTQTPEVYASYPLTGLPYYRGMTNAVRFDTVANRRNIWNFHNQQDFALGPFSWELNQHLKPDVGWGYDIMARRFQRTIGGLEAGGILDFNYLSDGYAIYAHIAEARSYALGAAERNGFTVRGQIAAAVNLNATPFSYAGGSHEHSAQFNSIIMHRYTYWSELLRRFDIIP